jgi:hypothetical protein
MKSKTAEAMKRSNLQRYQFHHQKRSSNCRTKVYVLVCADVSVS